MYNTHYHTYIYIYIYYIFSCICICICICTYIRSNDEAHEDSQKDNEGNEGNESCSWRLHVVKSIMLKYK